MSLTRYIKSKIWHVNEEVMKRPIYEFQQIDDNTAGNNVIIAAFCLALCALRLLHFKDLLSSQFARIKFH